MSPFLRLLCVFIITYSQEYTYNDNYQLSQSNWEATCLFYYDTHLASIHNASQLLDAQTTALDVAWIGATDTTLEGTWLWTDSTAFDYGLTNSQPPWASGEPNDETPGEDCVEIAAEGLWNDLPCSTLNGGLCASPIPTPVINDKSSYVRSRQQPGYLGMIDILDEIYIDFYITFTSWPTGWGNILQFGDSAAQKYPAIYIDGATHNVISSFTTVTTSNPEQSTTTSGYALDTEYHYTLSQTQRGFKVTFGGNYEYEEIYDYTVAIEGLAVSHPIVMNQAINLGSDWDGDFGATIRNLVVTTANSPETTFWNYICDWDDRWATRIGGSWGWGLGGAAIGGDCSIRQNEITPTTGIIAWMGEKDPTSLLWTDYKLEMLINLLSGDSVGPMFRATNHDCEVHNCGNSYHLTMRTTGYDFVKFAGVRTVLYTHSMAHTLDTQYLVRVECVGSTFKIYEDNEYLFNYSDASYAAGSVGFRAYESDVRISKLRITFPQDQQWYTANPSASPTKAPTSQPTLVPITTGTAAPTSRPTLIPTFVPTSQPTLLPTAQPTAAPTTSGPTTSVPTTSVPTTSVPTTSVPTTSVPTTSVPTTSSPTTSVPTTFVPTTSLPTTSVPSTFVPTKYPAKSPSKSPTNLPTKSPRFAEQEKEERGTTIYPTGNDYKSNITANQKGSNSGLYIAVIIIVVCFVFGVAALFVYKFWKKNQRNISIIIKDRVSSMSNVEMTNVKSSGEDEVVMNNSGDNNDSDLVEIINKTDMGMINMSDVEIVDVQSNSDDDGVAVDNAVLEMVNSTDFGIMDNVHGVNVVETDGGYIGDFAEKQRIGKEPIIQVDSNENNFMFDGFAAKQIIGNEPGMPKHAENDIVEGIDYDINEDGAKEIYLWLDSIGLLRYYDIFIQNGFDSLAMIREINNENDLESIGIALKAHRLKVINHIKKIRQ